MNKKTWVTPEVRHLNVEKTEAGNGPISAPDSVYSDGQHTWYSFPDPTPNFPSNPS